MSNIKAILFDASDILLDHYERERQALKYLFNSIGIKYGDLFIVGDVNQMVNPAIPIRRVIQLALTIK